MGTSTKKKQEQPVSMGQNAKPVQESKNTQKGLRAILYGRGDWHRVLREIKAVAGKGSRGHGFSHMAAWRLRVGRLMEAGLETRSTANGFREYTWPWTW